MQARSFSVCFEYNGFRLHQPIFPKIFTWICYCNVLQMISIHIALQHVFESDFNLQTSTAAVVARLISSSSFQSQSKAAPNIEEIQWQMHHTVHGRNPAPVERQSILIIYRVLYIHGAGFFHQQYFLQNSGWDHRFAKICYHHNEQIQKCLANSKHSCFESNTPTPLPNGTNN